MDEARNQELRSFVRGELEKDIQMFPPPSVNYNKESVVRSVMAVAWDKNIEYGSLTRHKIQEITFLAHTHEREQLQRNTPDYKVVMKLLQESDAVVNPPDVAWDPLSPVLIAIQDHKMVREEIGSVMYEP